MSLPNNETWGYETDYISPEDLISKIAESIHSSIENYAALPKRERCDDIPEYYRVCMEFPLSEKLANQFMNGRTGYRAHYSIDIETGEKFNRQVIDKVAPIIIDAKDRYSFDAKFCEESLKGQFTKFWFPKTVSDYSQRHKLYNLPEVIQISRWKNYWEGKQKPWKGLLAPQCEAILINGTFVANGKAPYQQKITRSNDLYQAGWV